MQITVTQPRWRGNYDVGSVGFISRKRDFVSTGISWFSRWDELPGDPPITHTFIIAGPDETIEAFARGVKRGSLQAYINDPNVALLIRKPKRYSNDLGKRVVTSARTHLGNKYGFGLIVADALANSFLGHWINRIFHGWPNRVVCRLLDSDCTMICSELVATALNQPELVGGGFLLNPANTVIPQQAFEDDYVFESGAQEFVK